LCKQNANSAINYYSPNYFIFRAKKFETKSTMKKIYGKVRFCLNIDIRKEMEDSWLNAINRIIAFIKDRLNLSSKSTAAANAHLMKSLFLDTLAEE